VTRAEFRAQFESVPLVDGEQLRRVIKLDCMSFGYPIYRALDRLVLLDCDGRFYLTDRTKVAANTAREEANT